MQTRFLGRASLVRDDDERFLHGGTRIRMLFLILRRKVTIRGVRAERAV